MVWAISSKTTTLRVPRMPTCLVARLTNRLAGVVLPPEMVNTRGDRLRSRNVLPVCRGPSSIRLTLRSTSGDQPGEQQQPRAAIRERARGVAGRLEHQGHPFVGGELGRGACSRPGPAGRPGTA